MASRKRSYGIVSAGDVMVLENSDLIAVEGCYSRISDTQPTGKDQCKRVQTNNSAVGSLTQQEVTEFVQKLGAHISAHPEVLYTHAGLDAAGLQSFAEINSVLQQHFMHMSGAMLRGYHSFTTQDRQSLWVNYAKAYGVSELAAKAPVSSPQQYHPRHLQLVRFLLEWVIQDQASITEYKVSLPPWLVGYAAKWGLGDCTVISLLVLQAYAPIDPGCSRTSSSRAPVYRIFVPMLTD